MSYFKTCGNVRGSKGDHVQKEKEKTERILLKHDGLPRLRVDGLNNACDSGTKGDEGDGRNCVA